MAASNGLMRTSRCTPFSPLQVAVGVGAAHREGGALDARLLAVLPVEQLDLVAVALGPAQVHAQQHLGPVLRLGAAGAGMDRQDRAALVVGARELELELERGELRVEALGEGAHLGLDRGRVLVVELAPGGELVGVLAQAAQDLDLLLGGAAALQDRLVLLGPRPERRVLHRAVERGELVFYLGALKDTPGGRRGDERDDRAPGVPWCVSAPSARERMLDASRPDAGRI